MDVGLIVGFVVGPGNLRRCLVHAQQHEWGRGLEHDGARPRVVRGIHLLRRHVRRRLVHVPRALHPSRETPHREVVAHEPRRRTDQSRDARLQRLLHIVAAVVVVVRESATRRERFRREGRGHGAIEFRGRTLGAGPIGHHPHQARAHLHELSVQLRVPVRAHEPRLEHALQHGNRALELLVRLDGVDRLERVDVGLRHAHALPLAVAEAVRRDCVRDVAHERGRDARVELRPVASVVDDVHVRRLERARGKLAHELRCFVHVVRVDLAVGHDDEARLNVLKALELVLVRCANERNERRRVRVPTWAPQVRAHVVDPRRERRRRAVGPLHEVDGVVLPLRADRDPSNRLPVPPHARGGPRDVDGHDGVAVPRRRPFSGFRAGEDGGKGHDSNGFGRGLRL